MILISGIALLGLLIAQAPTPALRSDSSGLTVQRFKWYRYRQNWEQREPETEPSDTYTRPMPRGRPTSDSTLPNKGINPVERSIEDRSADMGNIEAQASQDEHRQRRDGYIYEFSLRNEGDKPIRSFTVEYTPGISTGSGSPGENPTRRIICDEKIGARSSRTFKVFSLLPPVETISANAADRKTMQGVADDIMIDRVVFADGAMWNRTDSEFAKANSIGKNRGATGSNCKLF